MVLLTVMKSLFVNVDRVEGDGGGGSRMLVETKKEGEQAEQVLNQVRSPAASCSEATDLAIAIRK